MRVKRLLQSWLEPRESLLTENENVTYFAQIVLSEVESLHLVVVLLGFLFFDENLHNEDGVVKWQVLHKNVYVSINTPE